MKRSLSIILKLIAALFLLIIILLFTVPVIFKDKIMTKVEQAAEASLNATVKFDDYSLGFFRNFPNLSFSLTGLSVVGRDKFANDTLASVKNFDLVFNLSSLFGKSGYEIRSILIDKASFNTIVLKDGSANWDIMKDTAKSTAAPADGGSSSFKVLLKRVAISNSSVSYTDHESDIQTSLKGLNVSMKGDMTSSDTDLRITGGSSEFTYAMDGLTYLKKTVLDADIDMLANFDRMKFTFRENYLAINGLRVNFSGTVEMPADDITTDISFKTAETSFSSLLSLIPAVYMKDFDKVKTEGEFLLSGTAKGVYSDADSSMPDVSLDLSVKNASVSYPSMPEKIQHINILAKIFADGRVLDRSTVNISQFHLEVAGSPIDMSLALKTPVSDPDFRGSASGRLDLTALSKAVPMDSMSLSGIIDMSLDMAGKMSMIERGQYDQFRASGKINIRNMVVEKTGIPGVKIDKANFEFTPAYASLTNTTLRVGKNSDFSLNGKLSNYIPYFLKKQTLKGELSVQSDMIDVSDILSGMSSDTAAATSTPSEPVSIPRNIDFDLAASALKLKYAKFNGEKVRGHLIIRDGILSVKETGMNALDGLLTMNADYDTRDSLKPVMKADFDMQNIAVKGAFTTFNTVQKLAPASKGIDGKVSVKIGFSSAIGRDMMPVINTISGEGRLRSEAITLVESQTFDQVKQFLKLGSNYSNTFKDVNVSFRISNGRIFVSPFDIKTGNLKMNIGGDQGLDQTLNYLVRTEMPRSDLGGSVNSLIDNLSAQAAAFGINYKPSETIKVNLRIGGTFAKPEISPVFGNTSGTGSQSPGSATAGAVKDKARSEAEQQAAQIVKEAEDKAQLMRDEAAKAAESIRKEADTRAKKLVEDNAKKSQLEQIAAGQGAEAIRKGADKKANQLVKEADNQANKLVEEAKKKSDELLKKI